MDFSPLRRHARGMGLVCCLTTALLAGKPAAAEEWRAYTYNAVATVTAVKGLNAMIDAINKETKGQLTLRLNLGGTLPITADNITQAVSDGVVQFADDSTFGGNVPIGGLVRLPLLLQTYEQFVKAWDIEAEYLRADMLKKDVVLLGRYVFPEQVIWSKKKTTELADLAGQKIRVISPEQGELVKRLGGVPVTLGTSEVPAALDRGVIDGVMTATSGYGYVWRDLFKYNYRLPVCFIDSLIEVNKDAWDKLSPDLRAQVQSLVNEYDQKTTDAMAAEDKDLTKKVADGGIIVTEPTAADLAKAEAVIRPFWDEWGKTKRNGVQAVKRVREAVGR